MSQPTVFHRMELKYQISPVLAEEIRAFIAPYCAPDVNNGADGYTIFNLYLDTPRFHFHQAWKRREEDRLKLRVRAYSRENPYGMMEVKRKTGHFIRKTRGAVPMDQLAEAAAGMYVPKHARDRAHVEAFAYWRSVFGADPKCFVRYRREAYTSQVDSYGRVTFDRDIQGADGQDTDAMQDWDIFGTHVDQWFSLDHGTLLGSPESPVILELKCERSIPSWMMELIHRFELKNSGFSKYGSTVEAYLREGHFATNGVGMWT